MGGYGSHFYGGEDTFLCLKIIKKGLRIVYDPKVVVYHHRREFLIPYLKQIANIGKHRGYFAKKYPETSMYLWYFIPALAAVGFLALFVGSFIYSSVATLFIAGLTLSLTVSFLSVIRHSSIIMAFLASVGIVSTHLVYGLMFIKGLSTRNLHR